VPGVHAPCMDGTQRGCMSPHSSSHLLSLWRSCSSGCPKPPENILVMFHWVLPKLFDIQLQHSTCANLAHTFVESFVAHEPTKPHTTHPPAVSGLGLRVWGLGHATDHAPPCPVDFAREHARFLSRALSQEQPRYTNTSKTLRSFARLAFRLHKPNF
jgi:hypothetical protein